MHPWEDWAETFAHVLHILDTIQTAASFGMKVDRGPTGSDVLSAEPEIADAFAGEPDSFGIVMDEWLPLTYALNAVNRSMGRRDLYPFVLGPEVIEKLAFVHDAIVRSSATDRV